MTRALGPKEQLAEYHRQIDEFRNYNAAFSLLHSALYFRPHGQLHPWIAEAAKEAFSELDGYICWVADNIKDEIDMSKFERALESLNNHGSLSKSDIKLLAAAFRANYDHRQVKVSLGGRYSGHAMQIFEEIFVVLRKQWALIDDQEKGETGGQPIRERAFDHIPLGLSKGYDSLLIAATKELASLGGQKQVITLIIGEDEALVHAHVLTDKCLRWRKALAIGMQERINSRIEVIGYDSSIVYRVIYYLYTGRYDWAPEMLQRLGTASNLPTVPQSALVESDIGLHAGVFVFAKEYVIPTLEEEAHRRLWRFITTLGGRRENFCTEESYLDTEEEAILQTMLEHLMMYEEHDEILRLVLRVFHVLKRRALIGHTGNDPKFNPLATLTATALQSFARTVLDPDVENAQISYFGVNQPLNDCGTAGSLLYAFYDSPLENQLDISPNRVQFRAVFNHPRYPDVHPAGHARLEYVLQIGDGTGNDCYILFEPDHQNLLSEAELGRALMRAFNLPRDADDINQIRHYEKYPHHTHPVFAPETYGMLARRAKDCENHTLGEREWRESEVERDNLGRGFRCEVNVDRVITCLKYAKEAHENGAVLIDVLSKARLMKRDAISRQLIQQVAKHFVY